MGYARFRADPAKVRVGVRGHSTGYMITVESRTTTSHKVVRAGWLLAEELTAALEEAERRGMPGIDVDMWWSYEHPHGAGVS